MNRTLPAGLGLLGSDLILNNLELRLDALQDLIPTPLAFEFTRGYVRVSTMLESTFVHHKFVVVDSDSQVHAGVYASCLHSLLQELRIHIPWTSMLSSSIHVRLDTVECVLTAQNARNYAQQKAVHERKLAALALDGVSTPASTTSAAAAQGGGLPEWAQSWLTRIVANVSLSIHNLVFKYQHDDVSLVVGLRSLDVASADPDAGWAHAFVEPEGRFKHVHKVITVRDLTVTMDAGNEHRGGHPLKSSSASAASHVSVTDTYLEEPILSKTNVLVRARIPLEQNPRPSSAASAADDEAGDGIAAPSGAQQISAGSTAAKSNLLFLEPSALPTSSTPSPLEQVAAALQRDPASLASGSSASHDPLWCRRDPFATPLLSRYPADLGHICIQPASHSDGATAKSAAEQVVVLPVSACTTLCHVYVDAVDFGVSPRQVQMLQRLTTLPAIAAPFEDDDDGQPPDQDQQLHNELADEQLDDKAGDGAEANEKAGKGGGLFEWLWGSVTSTTEDDETRGDDSGKNEGASTGRLGNARAKGSSSTAMKPTSNSATADAQQSPPAFPKIVVANAHVGSVSLVLYRHEAKKLKARGDDDRGGPTSPSPGDASSSAGQLHLKTPSTIRVPVSNLGFVTIDARPPRRDESNAANDGRVDLTSPGASAKRHSLQHVPVPFLRLAASASWAQARILEPGALQQLHNSDGGAGTTTVQKAQAMAAVESATLSQVLDIYLDLGSIRVMPWSIELESAEATQRAAQRARLAKVLLAISVPPSPFKSFIKKPDKAATRPAAGTQGSLDAELQRSRSSTGGDTSSIGGGGVDDADDGGSQSGRSQATPVKAPSTRQPGAANRSGSDVLSEVRTPSRTGGLGGIASSPNDAFQRGVAAGAPCVLVCGVPGELASLASGALDAILGAAAATSPGPAALQPTQLRRHPYFECSLFPEVDADVVAGPTQVGANRVDFSVLAGSGTDGAGSASVMQGLPLSLRAHICIVVPKFANASVDAVELAPGKQRSSANSTRRSASKVSVHSTGSTDDERESRDRDDVSSVHSRSSRAKRHRYDAPLSDGIAPASLITAQLLVAAITARADPIIVRDTSRFAACCNSAAAGILERPTGASPVAGEPALASTDVITDAEQLKQAPNSAAVQISMSFGGITLLLPSATDTTMMLEAGAGLVDLRFVQNMPYTALRSGNMTSAALELGIDETDASFEGVSLLYARDVLALASAAATSAPASTTSEASSQSLRLACRSTSISGLLSAEGLHIDTRLSNSGERAIDAGVTAASCAIDPNVLLSWISGLNAITAAATGVDRGHTVAKSYAPPTSGFAPAIMQLSGASCNLLVDADTASITLKCGLDGFALGTSEGCTVAACGSILEPCVQFGLSTAGLPAVVLLPFFPPSRSVGTAVDAGDSSGPLFEVDLRTAAGTLDYRMLQPVLDCLASSGEVVKASAPIPSPAGSRVDLGPGEQTHTSARHGDAGQHSRQHPNALESWWISLFALDQIQHPRRESLPTSAQASVAAAASTRIPGHGQVSRQKQQLGLSLRPDDVLTQSRELHVVQPGPRFILREITLRPWTLTLCDVAAADPSDRPGSLSLLLPGITVSTDTNGGIRRAAVHCFQATDLMMLLVDADGSATDEFCHVSVDGTVEVDSKRSLSSSDLRHVEWHTDIRANVGTARSKVNIQLLQALSSIKPLKVASDKQRREVMAAEGAPRASAASSTSSTDDAGGSASTSVSFGLLIPSAVLLLDLSTPLDAANFSALDAGGSNDADESREIDGMLVSSLEVQVMDVKCSAEVHTAAAPSNEDSGNSFTCVIAAVEAEHHNGSFSTSLFTTTTSAPDNETGVASTAEAPWFHLQFNAARPQHKQEQRLLAKKDHDAVVTLLLPNPVQQRSSLAIELGSSTVDVQASFAASVGRWLHSVQKLQRASFEVTGASGIQPLRHGLHQPDLQSLLVGSARSKCSAYGIMVLPRIDVSTQRTLLRLTDDSRSSSIGGNNDATAALCFGFDEAFVRCSPVQTSADAEAISGIGPVVQSRPVALGVTGGTAYFRVARLPERRQVLLPPSDLSLQLQAEQTARPGRSEGVYHFASSVRASMSVSAIAATASLAQLQSVAALLEAYAAPGLSGSEVVAPTNPDASAKPAQTVLAIPGRAAPQLAVSAIDVDDAVFVTLDAPELLAFHLQSTQAGRRMLDVALKLDTCTVEQHVQYGVELDVDTVILNLAGKHSSHALSVAMLDLTSNLDGGVPNNLLHRSPTQPLLEVNVSGALSGRTDHGSRHAVSASFQPPTMCYDALVVLSPVALELNSSWLKAVDAELKLAPFSSQTQPAAGGHATAAGAHRQHLAIISVPSKQSSATAVIDRTAATTVVRSKVVADAQQLHLVGSSPRSDADARAGQPRLASLQHPRSPVLVASCGKLFATANCVLNAPGNGRADCLVAVDDAAIVDLKVTASELSILLLPRRSEDAAAIVDMSEHGLSPYEWAAGHICNTLVPPFPLELSSTIRSFQLPVRPTSSSPLTSEQFKGGSAARLSHIQANVKTGDIRLVLDGAQVATAAAWSRAFAAINSSEDSVRLKRSINSRAVPVGAQASLSPASLAASNYKLMAPMLQQHGLSHLPVIHSSSLDRQHEATALGPTSIASEAMHLAGIELDLSHGAGAGSGFQCERVYVSDVVTWVPHSSWISNRPSADGGSPPQQLYAHQHVMISHADYVRACVREHKDTYGAGPGAWWGSAVWSYAMPVVITDVSASGPVCVAPHTFIRMHKERRAAVGVPVSVPSVSQVLHCVLERLDGKGSDNGGSATIGIAGGANEPADLQHPPSLFTRGWVPVCSFKMSALASVVPVAGHGHGVSDVVWHDDCGHNPSIADCESLSTLAELSRRAGSASTTWRLRWLEPTFTASRPDPLSQPMVAHASSTGDHNSRQRADAGPAQELTYRMMHSPYAGVCTAIARVIQLEVAWTATGLSTGFVLPTIPSAVLSMTVPSMELHLRDRCWVGEGDADAVLDLGARATARSSACRSVVVRVEQVRVGHHSYQVFATSSLPSSSLQLGPVQSSTIRASAAIDVAADDGTALSHRLLQADGIHLQISSAVAGRQVYLASGADQVQANVLPQPLLSFMHMAKSYQRCLSDGAAANQTQPNLPDGISITNNSDISIQVAQAGLCEGYSMLVPACGGVSAWTWPSIDAFVRAPAIRSVGFTRALCIASADDGDAADATLKWSAPLPVDEALVSESSVEVKATAAPHQSVRYVAAPRHVLFHSGGDGVIERDGAAEGAAHVVVPVVVRIADPGESSAPSVEIRTVLTLRNTLPTSVTITWRQALPTPPPPPPAAAEEVAAVVQAHPKGGFMSAIGSLFGFGSTASLDSQSSCDNGSAKEKSVDAENSAEVDGPELAPVPAAIAGRIELSPGQSIGIACLSPTSDFPVLLNITVGVDLVCEEVTVDGSHHHRPMIASRHSALSIDVPSPTDTTLEQSFLSSGHNAGNAQVRAFVLKSDPEAILGSSLRCCSVSLQPWMSVDNKTQRHLSLIAGLAHMEVPAASQTALLPPTAPTEPISFMDAEAAAKVVSFRTLAAPSPSVAVLTASNALATALSQSWAASDPRHKQPRARAESSTAPDQRLGTKSSLHNVSSSVSIPAPAISSERVRADGNEEPSTISLLSMPSVNHADEAVIVRQSHDKSGNHVRLSAPLRVDNCVAVAAIRVQLEPASDVVHHHQGASRQHEHGHNHPGSVPVAALGSQEVLCLPSIIADVQGRPCVPATISWAAASVPADHRPPPRLLLPLVPGRVVNTLLPHPSNNDWTLPIVIQCLLHMDGDAGVPMLVWRLMPRAVLRVSSSMPLELHHADVDFEGSFIRSAIAIAPPTSSAASAVDGRSKRGQPQPIWVPACSVYLGSSAMLTAIHLQLRSASSAAEATKISPIGAIALRLDHRGGAGHGGDIDDGDAVLQQERILASPSRWREHAARLSRYLRAPSLPVGHAARVPICTAAGTGEHQKLQELRGLLVIRSTCDADTGIVTICISDDAQPPIRLVNDLDCDISIRMRNRPALFARHQTALQLAYHNPLERIGILATISSEAEDAVREVHAQLALVSRSPSPVDSAAADAAQIAPAPSPSVTHTTGSLKAASAGSITDPQQLSDAELALAEIKVLLEREVDAAEAWMQLAVNSEPAALSQHPLWASRYASYPSEAILIQAGTAIDFDWSLMADLGFDTAFGPATAGGLAKWIPWYPTAWTSPSSSSSSTASSADAAGVLEQVPSLPDIDLDASAESSGELLALAKVWRLRTANAALKATRVFESGAPVQHLYQSVEVAKAAMSDHASELQYHNAVVTSSGNDALTGAPWATASTTTSSASQASSHAQLQLPAELIDGTLVVKLFAPGADAAAPRATSAVQTVVSAVHIKSFALSLLHPAAVPTPIAREAGTAWWTSSASALSSSSDAAPSPRTDVVCAGSTTDIGDALATMRNIPSLRRNLLHRELMTLHIQDTSVYVVAAGNDGEVDITLSLRRLQLDDHQQYAAFPVVAILQPLEDGPDRARALTIKLNLARTHSRSSTGPAVAIASADVVVGLLRLQLSDTVADQQIPAYARWLPALTAASGRLMPPSAPSPSSAPTHRTDGAATIPAAASALPKALSLDVLRLGPVAVEVTFCTAKAGTPVFLAIDRMPVSLSAVQCNQLLAAPEIVARELLASYLTDVLLRTPALLGSFDILGNPTGLARSLAAGVYDLFAMPMRASMAAGNRSVLALIQGVGRGWASLAGHIAAGTLGSVAGLAMSLARNLDRMTKAQPPAATGLLASASASSQSASMLHDQELPWYFVELHTKLQEVLIEDDADFEALNAAGSAFTGPNTLASGTSNPGVDASPSVAGVRPSIVHGFAGLGRGLVGAVTDIASASAHVVSEPNRGVGPALADLGRGFAGAVTKPITGALELIAHATTSVMLAVRLAEPMLQIRPRACMQAGHNIVSLLLRRILPSFNRVGSGDAMMAPQSILALSPTLLIQSVSAALAGAVGGGAGAERRQVPCWVAIDASGLRIMRADNLQPAAIPGSAVVAAGTLLGFREQRAGSFRIAGCVQPNNSASSPFFSRLSPAAVNALAAASLITVSGNMNVPSDAVCITIQLLVRDPPPLHAGNEGQSAQQAHLSSTSLRTPTKQQAAPTGTAAARATPATASSASGSASAFNPFLSPAAVSAGAVHDRDRSGSMSGVAQMLGLGHRLSSALIHETENVGHGPNAVAHSHAARAYGLADGQRRRADGDVVAVDLLVPSANRRNVVAALRQLLENVLSARASV